MFDFELEKLDEQLWREAVVKDLKMLKKRLALSMAISTTCMVVIVMSFFVLALGSVK